MTEQGKGTDSPGTGVRETAEHETGRGADAGRDRETGRFRNSSLGAAQPRGSPEAARQGPLRSHEGPIPLRPGSSQRFRHAGPARPASAAGRSLKPLQQGGKQTRRPWRPERRLESSPRPPSPWRRSTCSCRPFGGPGPKGNGQPADNGAARGGRCARRRRTRTLRNTPRLPARP